MKFGKGNVAYLDIACGMPFVYGNRAREMYYSTDLTSSFIRISVMISSRKALRWEITLSFMSSAGAGIVQSL